MSFLNIFSGIGKVLSGRGKPNLMPALDPFAARYNDLMRLKYEQQLADWQRNYDQAMQAYLTQNAGMAPQVVAQRIAALTRALEPYSWLQPGRMARGAWQMYQELERLRQLQEEAKQHALQQAGMQPAQPLPLIRKPIGSIGGIMPQVIPPTNYFNVLGGLFRLFGR
jgi:hypothetical protein